jgi:hypothetical protein
LNSTSKDFSETSKAIQAEILDREEYFYRLIVGVFVNAAFLSNRLKHLGIS